MLETRKERVKLLKAGLSGRMIERLYIEGNNFRIISFPPAINLMELDIPKDRNNHIRHEAAAKCA
jgi:hypothetical protein